MDKAENEEANPLGDRRLFAEASGSKLSSTGQCRSTSQKTFDGFATQIFQRTKNFRKNETNVRVTFFTSPRHLEQNGVLRLQLGERQLTEEAYTRPTEAFRALDG